MVNRQLDFYIIVESKNSKKSQAELVMLLFYHIVSFLLHLLQWANVMNNPDALLDFSKPALYLEKLDESKASLLS